MQLIHLSEPTPIDIKKTMSTVGEVLEDSQINGVITDIVNDVCTKIISTKDNQIPKPFEETEHKKDKDCNGITKTNGDSQIEHGLTIKIESEVIENSEDKLNGESNGSVSNDSLSSTSAPISEVEIEEIITSKLVEQVKGSVETNRIESASNIEVNSSENVDPPASVKHKEVPQDKITGQLLENDENKSLPEVTNPTMDDNIPEAVENISSNNIELNSPDMPTTAPEVKEIKYDESTTQQVNDVKIVAECEASPILPAEKTRMNTTEKEIDNSLNEASSTVGLTENEITANVPELQENIDNTSKNEEESMEVIVKLNEESDNIKHCSDFDMELDKKEPKTMEGQDDSKKSVLEPSIPVENITELSSSISPPKDSVNNGVVEASSEHEKVNKNESMEVGDPDVSIVTPENDKLNTIDKLTIVPNDAETSITNSTETIKNTSKVENKVQITEKETDDVFMEIDDNDEINVVDKSQIESVVERRSKDITKADVSSNDNNSKQDSVINIIDNDDDENTENTEKKYNTTEVISIDDSVSVSEVSSETGKQVMKVVEQILEEIEYEKLPKTPEQIETKTLPIVCKLSNTMDILSDEEDETPVEVKKTNCEDLKTSEISNKCINVDEDDDIMFIEDTNSPKCTNEDLQSEQKFSEEKTQSEKADIKSDVDECAVNKFISDDKVAEKITQISEKVDSPSKDATNVKSETKPVDSEVSKESEHNFITKDFLKSVTKNLADMTRNELEDFCILKLVESVVDKSNLNEIKIKMKTMAQTVEDLRKKALALAKQNRDLQVVVKTVQEDQKKRNSNPMMPMKITRSVGMQVMLTVVEKDALKKKQIAPPPLTQNKQVRTNQTKTQKPTAAIPVPRLVPASSPTVKSPVAANTTKTVTKTTPQRPEKRPHSKISPASSVTVDLTDDEPPTKVVSKSLPVRLVPSQNLMPKTRPQFNQANASPRKVYIPISPTNQNVRPGTGIIRNFVPTPRPRQPSVVRMQAVRLQTPTANRHPAPLPDAMKQYQPPAWKALPPAPDLKLSKVDNGIVISWKFEGYQPDSYEEVASFQLYAYQETPAPPSTALWKKIGDIKALPLPMACTLTQFMSGFKYYFAVRAIDIRSRIGPFSLPGSIMLISKT